MEQERSVLPILLFVAELVLGQPGESLVHAERVLHLEDINARIAEHLGQEDFHDYSGQSLGDSLGHLEINVQRLPVHVGQSLRIHLCQNRRSRWINPIVASTWKSKEGNEVFLVVGIIGRKIVSIAIYLRASSNSDSRRRSSRWPGGLAYSV